MIIQVELKESVIFEVAGNSNHVQRAIIAYMASMGQFVDSYEEDDYADTLLQKSTEARITGERVFMSIGKFDLQIIR